MLRRIQHPIIRQVMFLRTMDFEVKKQEMQSEMLFWGPWRHDSLLVSWCSIWVISNSWFYSVMWISEVSENQSALKKAYNLVLPHIYEEKFDILGLWLKESWFQRFSCHHSSLELHSLVSHFVFTMHMWFQEVADALVSHQNHMFLAGHLQGVWEFTPLNRMGITWN